MKIHNTPLYSTIVTQTNGFFHLFFMGMIGTGEVAAVWDAVGQPLLPAGLNMDLFYDQ
jgi:hypothetical protein